MATPHLATCMSLLSTSSGLLGEPATESHTSISVIMSCNECYNVCSGNGTIYCALQGDRCICSVTCVRSSVGQRGSAASTRTQMQQSVITGLFQATQRSRMKSIIVGNYFHHWKWHYPCHLDSWFAAYQAREKSTAPPQSSELPLTRNHRRTRKCFGASQPGLCCAVLPNSPLAETTLTRKETRGTKGIGRGRSHAWSCS